MPGLARRLAFASALAPAFAMALTVGGCGSTTDSLGYDNPGKLLPVTGPTSYPNPFRDLLGESDSAISGKITQGFNTLFHGAPSYKFYETMMDDASLTADQAYVTDTLHNDTRTEGMGLGMMICVEMNKQHEFDQLWSYAKEVLEIKSGPQAGYFPSFCNGANDTPTPCLDPYGFQQFVTALIFANDRWQSTGTIDYASDVLELLHTARHKQEDNGGIVDGVTNLYDAATTLPFDVPDVSSADVTRPSLVMPGSYGLWTQATGDPYWTASAAAGRAFWQSAANTLTGFMPTRATLDGTPVPGWSTFEPEGYRTQINVAIDQIWTGGDSWNVAESNQLLAFFSAQGLKTYGKIYSLDGTMVLESDHEPSLVVANGITAVASTNADRSSYVSEVWNMEIPTGTARYYTGILYMVSLLVLSGQYQVY
ncbi:MAG TPA: glycosyl hydrolase family 8 [Polyangia bacterium]|jgi:oligosaccharide reducing-end xylanase